MRSARSAAGGFCWNESKGEAHNWKKGLLGFMITPEQYREMQVRVGMVKPEPVGGVKCGVPSGEEIDHLHNPIIEWCRTNRVPYVHARPDKESTIGEGVCDFILPYQGKVFFVECKTREGKLSPAQLAFKVMLEMQGHELRVIRDMDAFYKLMNLHR